MGITPSPWFTPHLTGGGASVPSEGGTLFLGLNSDAKRKGSEWHLPLSKVLTLNLTMALLLKMKSPEPKHSASSIGQGSWEVWPLFWEAMWPTQIFFTLQRKRIDIGSKLTISATDTCLFTNHFCLDKWVLHNLLSERWAWRQDNTVSYNWRSK